MLQVRDIGVNLKPAPGGRCSIPDEDETIELGQDRMQAMKVNTFITRLDAILTNDSRRNE
jgi:hypothetical protein